MSHLNHVSASLYFQRQLLFKSNQEKKHCATYTTAGQSARHDGDVDEKQQGKKLILQLGLVIENS